MSTTIAVRVEYEKSPLMSQTLGKVRRLLWVGIISLLAVLSAAFIAVIFVEPARTGVRLIYSDHNIMRVRDYVGFYYAGWMALSPERHHVYDPEVRMRTSNELAAPYKLGEPLYTGYLPIVFPMMVPFALVSLTQSYFLWCAVTVSFGMTALILFSRHVMHWPPRYIWTFCLYTFLSVFGSITLHLGQVVWLLLGLDLLFFRGLLQNKDITGGIALAIATVKPQYSIPLFAAALGAGRWKLAITTVATLAILFGLAGLTIGFDNLVLYPKLLHHTEQSDLTARAMASIRPILYAVLPPTLALQASLAVWVLTIAGIGYLWWISRDKSAETKRWLGALTILLALVTSPHTHGHDLLLIAAAAAMTLHANINKGSIAERLWLIILVLYPIAGYAFCVMPIGPHLSRWPFVLTNLILVALATICYSANFRSGAVSAEDRVLD